MSDVGATGRECPWCSAPAPAVAASCDSCGAALAQRESLGDVAIPGVTAIDPALQGLDGRPMRIPGPSRTQGVADGAIVAAVVIGGPVGLAALGGIAAVAAAEYAGAGRDRMGAPASLEAVGRPSEVTLQALAKVEESERGVAGEPRATPRWTRGATSRTGRTPPTPESAATGRAQDVSPA
jgi:hypothetical protein